MRPFPRQADPPSDRGGRWGPRPQDRSRPSGARSAAGAGGGTRAAEDTAGGAGAHGPGGLLLGWQPSALSGPAGVRGGGRAHLLRPGGRQPPIDRTAHCPPHLGGRAPVGAAWSLRLRQVVVASGRGVAPLAARRAGVVPGAPVSAPGAALPGAGAGPGPRHWPSRRLASPAPGPGGGGAGWNAGGRAGGDRR